MLGKRKVHRTTSSGVMPLFYQPTGLAKCQVLSPSRCCQFTCPPSLPDKKRIQKSGTEPLQNCMEPVLHSYITLRGTVNEVENEKKNKPKLARPQYRTVYLIPNCPRCVLCVEETKDYGRICSSALCQLIMSAKGTVTVSGGAAPDHPRKLPHGHATRNYARSVK